MEAIGLISLGIDFIIAISLISLAGSVLFAKNIFNAIIMFIIFGLLMAIAWVRLNAPDIALAEAALGAGITGALLLESLRKIRITEPETGALLVSHNDNKNELIGKLLVGVLTVTVAFYTIEALIPLAQANQVLAPKVFENLEASGVKNPVTAVLLNFRGYDTFLEIFVLYAALLGAWSIENVSNCEAKEKEQPENFILVTLIKLLSPFIVLVASYILWVGSFNPGGAFQAGAILAGLAVFMALTGWHFVDKIPLLLLRTLVIVGPLYFAAILVTSILLTGNLLQYSIDLAGVTIFSVEAFSTISIFMVLFLLYLGDEPKSYFMRRS